LNEWLLPWADKDNAIRENPEIITDSYGMVPMQGIFLTAIKAKKRPRLERQGRF